ncbi:MAG: hypothetical protein NUV68_02020 [Caldiserica bacterium]|jgi:hypothetical protein|nr:hypothetical protein [Caldisericota bacterium]MDH7562134.1 hypothetical protein [Caldisericota bacterium]
MRRSIGQFIRKTLESLSKKFWNFYEDFYEWLFRIKPVGPPGEGAFRWGITHYRGPGITLEDGVRIARGEVVGEIHTDNRLIMELRKKFNDPVSFYVEVLRRMRLSLGELAKISNFEPRLKKVKAFRGTTLLHEGARRLGFEVFPMETKAKEVWETKVQYFFLRKYMDEGFEKKREKGLVSKRIWLSKEKLIRLYGDHSTLK